MFGCKAMLVAIVFCCLAIVNVNGSGTCSLTITSTFTTPAVATGQYDFKWSMGGNVSSQVFIAVYSTSSVMDLQSLSQTMSPKQVGIEYYVWKIIPNTFSWSWTVPSNAPAGSSYGFYVEDASNNTRGTTCWTYSPPFSVVGPQIWGSNPTTAITESTYVFQWSHTGNFPQVYYSITQNTPFRYLEYGFLPNTGYYSWNVPNITTGAYTLYLETAANSARTTLTWNYIGFNVINIHDV